MDKPQRIYLTRAEAAAWLSASGMPCMPSTLQRWVTDGGGPKYERRGRNALYRISDLQAFLDNGAPSRPTPEVPA